MKKLKYEGFTLVELLAVIVILGAIAMIITPVIRKTITEAKLNNFINGAYELIKAGDLYYLENDMEVGNTEVIKFSFPYDTGDLQLKGEIPTDGEMIINKDGDIALAISNGDFCVGKTFSETKITAGKDLEDCSIYIDESLNGTTPELKEGMIPVVIDKNGTVYKSHTTSKWYDYSNKEWANAITVTNNTREKYIEADEGTIINGNDILTYFVWIPRYRYKLWYTEAVDYITTQDTSKVHSIDIVFENKHTKKSQGTTNGEYLTHPAFTFGDKELNGIWVGKFETGYNGATSSSNAQVNTASADKIIIKPYVFSWRSISIKNAFEAVKNMTKENNNFGLDKDSDTHMMKNTEWGVVAYLSHSIYGKNSNIYKNNNSSFYTGCGATSATSSGTSSCTNKFGSITTGVYNQSTTGNITGIFDMSGGSSEFVMGFNTVSTNTASGFTKNTLPESKYLNSYVSSNNATDYAKRILGDATGELGPFYNSGTIPRASSWYSSNSTFVGIDYPWFVRGGNYSSASANIFTYDQVDGSKVSSRSFRIVIS